jgi:hypothetical protein
MKKNADHGGRAVENVGLLPLACREIVGSNPTGTWMFDCYVCCVLSGRVLCVKLIVRPEEYNLMR